jgi:hypothetical protein
MMKFKVAPHVRAKSDDLIRSMQRQNSENTDEAIQEALAKILQLGGHMVSSLAIPELIGDVVGRISETIVQGIRGIPVSPAAPVDHQVLRYNATLNQWVPSTLGAGGGGGFYAVVSNGDVEDPQLVQDGTGDFVMAFIPGA